MKECQQKTEHEFRQQVEVVIEKSAAADKAADSVSDASEGEVQQARAALQAAEQASSHLAASSGQ